jgi:hypothetical protein
LLNGNIVYKFNYNLVGKNGIRLGGGVKFNDIIIGSGGCVIAGLNRISKNNTLQSRGGIVVSGSIRVSRVTYNKFFGGIGLGGLIYGKIIYKPKVIGGVKINGNYGEILSGTGGINVSGKSYYKKISRLYASGGNQLSGYGNIKVQYNQNTKSGLVISGSSVFAKLNYITSNGGCVLSHNNTNTIISNYTANNGAYINGRSLYKKITSLQSKIGVRVNGSNNITTVSNIISKTHIVCSGFATNPWFMRIIGNGNVIPSGIVRPTLQIDMDIMGLINIAPYTIEEFDNRHIVVINFTNVVVNDNFSSINNIKRTLQRSSQTKNATSGNIIVRSSSNLKVNNINKLSRIINNAVRPRR